MPQFTLWSDALNNNGEFDPRYTCDLDNSSPEIRWHGAPHNTASFALIVEDVDAESRPLTQWVVYRIPANLEHLPAGIPPQEILPNGIRQGINTFGKLGYTGPCPPEGATSHRYRFRLMALSILPELPPRATREQLLEIANSCLISTAEFFGHYERSMRKAG